MENCQQTRFVSTTKRQQQQQQQEKLENKNWETFDDMKGWQTMASKSVLSNNGNVSSGIIVDREKQRNVPAAPIKNKRCRFADDQAHIVQTTSATNDLPR